MEDVLTELRKQIGRLIRQVQSMRENETKRAAAQDEQIVALRARLDALEGAADFDRGAALIKSVRPEFRIYTNAGDGSDPGPDWTR